MSIEWNIVVVAAVVRLLPQSLHQINDVWMKVMLGTYLHDRAE